ncbi:hypothetical protein GON09_005034 [Rhodococcus sp. B50]|nr:hypothetical protein [Rhodococcus sp. B50]
MDPRPQILRQNSLPQNQIQAGRRVVNILRPAHHNLVALSRQVQSEHDKE